MAGASEILSHAATVVINVESIIKEGWYINDVTYARKGRVVVTGWALDGYSHITVIDRTTRKLLRQDKIKTKKKICPDRYCAFLSGSKVLTVSWPDEVGIYDVNDGSYEMHFMGDILPWPQGRLIRCVARNHDGTKVIIGSNSSLEYVFDENLTYCYSLEQPKGFNYWYDVTFSKDQFIVCDYFGKAAIAVTESTTRGFCHRLHELEKPDLNGADWRPLSVCSDRRMSPYVLWEAFTTCQRKCITKYSREVHQVLTTWSTDEDAHSITCMSEGDEHDQEMDTLIIATLKSGKIIFVSLVT